MENSEAEGFTDYVPNKYLIATSHFGAPELISLYTDFLQNLNHVRAVPHLVFERLFGNISVVYKSVMDKERQDFDASLQSYQAALDTLQKENDQLREELAQLRVVSSESKEPPLLDLVIGSFHTDDVRDLKARPHMGASKEITFATPFPEKPPSILVGFTALDVGIAMGERVRVRSFASDIRREGFKVNLETWGVPSLYGCGCEWLEVGAGDISDLSFGTVGWDRPWVHAKERFAQRVSFKRRYASPPVVVVWLGAFEMDNRRNSRIKTYASEVTPDGFTIHIDSWADTLLFGAESTWVAYSANRPGILSGVFNSIAVRGSRPPQEKISGVVSFINAFKTTPRIFMALNHLDIDCSASLRVSMKNSAKKDGFTWSVDTWLDSVLHAAGGCYIAMV